MSAEHGTRARYLAGCRCDACRAANTAYVMAYRRARGVRPAAERLDRKHPSVTAYTRRGCRCDACRAIMAAKARDYRARRRQREGVGSDSASGAPRADRLADTAAARASGDERPALGRVEGPIRGEMAIR